MARQAILERLGWRFVRIRGSHFFRNPDKAMEIVFERLQALDIPPEGNPVMTSTIIENGKELRERIDRRAAELRLAWAASEKRGYSQNIPAVSLAKASVQQKRTG